MARAPKFAQGNLGECPSCGKKSYTSKANAKRERNRLGFRDLHLYRCLGSGYWHLGHLPKSVLKGRVGREVLRRTP